MALSLLAACSDFFEPENKTVLRGDEYIGESGEMYSGFAGIVTRMQALVDHNIYLFDSRAETFVPTDRDTEMLNLSNYEDNLNGNSYADPSKYYDVIISCNDYLAKIYAYKKEHASSIDMTHYEGLVGGALRIKAWTYLNLAKVYGKVVWFDDPMTSMKDYSQYPRLDLDQTVKACRDLLEKGYDGINASHTFDWSEWLAGTDNINEGNWENWNYMTPPYFALAAELALWQEDYQRVVDILLPAMNNAFETSSGYYVYMCSENYSAKNYYRIFNGTKLEAHIVAGAITYNSKKAQTNTLSRNFYSAPILLASEAAKARYSDSEFNPLKKNSTDIREDQNFASHSDTEWKLRRYRSSESAVYMYRSVEFYLMLIEALNHLDRGLEMEILMNSGCDKYCTDVCKGDVDVFMETFKGFSKYWVQYSTSAKHGDFGFRGCLGLQSRSMKTDLTDAENIRHNDMEILKEYILEFPGEGKTFPAMIRMARRYGNDIIADLVCEKYKDVVGFESVSEKVRSKLEAGQYFVSWDIDGTSLH